MKGGPNDKMFIDFKQALKLLGMSEPWLRKQISQKLIPHYKLGRSLKFKIDELEDYAKTKKRA
jgi:excisionase family DNA binding protein